MPVSASLDNLEMQRGYGNTSRRERMDVLFSHVKRALNWVKSWNISESAFSPKKPYISEVR